MLITIFPLLIAIIGLLLWALAKNPVVTEAGRIMFFCGMFVLTWGLAGQTFRIG